MALAPALLEILRCPDEHHARLEHDSEAQTLTCTECGRVFAIRNDIPVMLLDDATSQATATTGTELAAEQSAEATAQQAEPETKLETKLETAPEISTDAEEAEA